MIMNDRHVVVEKDDQLYYVLETNIYTVYLPMHINAKMRSPVMSNDALISWKIQKPNIKLLYQFVIDAAYVARTMGSEVTGFVVLDLQSKKQEPVLFYPKQQVSLASCIYDRNVPEGHALLVDLHSHHTMECSFSHTDNADDGALSFIPRISIVVSGMSKDDHLGGFKTDARLSFRKQNWRVRTDQVFAAHQSVGIEEVVTKYEPVTPVVVKNEPIWPTITPNPAQSRSPMRRKKNDFGIDYLEGEDIL